MSRSLPLWTRRHTVILLIVLLAALLRSWAVLGLPIDADEPTYMRAAVDYAAAFRAGNLGAVVDYTGNPEHPPLVKLIYGGAVLLLGPSASQVSILYATRAVSAVFGTLAVLALVAVDPWAGALLAIDTLVVKYTSQTYLEAVPLFTALLAVLLLYRSRSSRDVRFWLSAAALGITGAGKFTYFPIIFVILYLAWEKKYPWRYWLAYLLVAGAAFFVFDPALWRDPAGRLASAIAYHINYQQGSEVARLGYPWYQPLIWISRSVPWHPEVYFYRGFDEIIFALSLAGLYLETRGRRWVVVWFVTSLVILLAWATKWPQYTLILIPALCLSAGAALRAGWDWIKENDEYWGWLQAMFPQPSVGFWFLVALFLLFVGGIYAYGAYQFTVGRIGWSHLTAAESGLPRDGINALVARGSDMLVGTDAGLAVVTPGPARDAVPQIRLLDKTNSSMPANAVLSLAAGNGNALWIGTPNGLARQDSIDWTVYHGSDFGLADERVNAIALGSNGAVWIGTPSGAAEFESGKWTPFTASGQGLLDGYVLSLATQPTTSGDVVWIGTTGGLSRYDTAAQHWQQFTPANSDLGWGGVSHLLIDSAGRLWAATLGGGLSMWDGSAWRAYRVSNSQISFNTITTVAEFEPGVYWIGAAYATEAGGALLRFDGTNWRNYSFSNSGFSGAEPSAIARDSTGRYWIGTRTRGIDIYEPQ